MGRTTLCAPTTTTIAGLRVALRVVAPRVREICERYGLRYTSGPLHRQYATVLRKINRYALPRRAERDAMLAQTAASVQALPVRTDDDAQRPVRLAG